ncbi:MAG: hypothetical protein NTZ84_00905 [Candidatus Nealsonbacteria bacterium]|nr:hypothetical protein [Candidatus Nealsonbacteria bacterium]
MVNITNVNIAGTMERIILIIFSPFQDGWIASLRFSFIVISLIIFFYIIYLLNKNTWLKRLCLEDWTEFFTWKAFGIKTAEKSWRKTKDRLLAGREHEYKMAVIEADNILSDILSKMEYGAGSDIETLNSLPIAIFPNIEGVKWAHGLNESISHDPDFRLSLEEARKAMDIYERFFIDAEIL